MPPTKLLITGVAGVPGFNAWLFFRKLYGDGVIGLLPGHRSAQISAGLMALDEENPGEVFRSWFAAQSFTHVLDASGWCALKACELDPARGRRLNFDFGLGIAEMCADRNIRLLRLSTDLVFSGSPRPGKPEPALGGYREEETVTPVTVYGRLMAEAEAAILACHPAATVLRLPLPMGPSLNGHAGAVDWIAGRFRRGLPATLYFDEVRSCLYVQDANRLFDELIRRDAGGIFHAGGPRDVTLFEIASHIHSRGGFAPELLRGCSRAEAGPLPPRAGHVGLDSSKLRALLPEWVPRPWPEEPMDGDADREAAEAVDARKGDLPRVERELYGYELGVDPHHPLTLMQGLDPASRPPHILSLH